MAKSSTQPILFSTQFDFDPEILRKKGIFDPALNVDTRLFIDPLLLKHSKNSVILDHSLDRYNAYFEGIIELMQQSKVENDFAWKNAKRLLSFSEKKGTCLGYGAETISGSAFGPQKTFNLMQNANAAIKLGIKNPNLFMLLSIFEANVGPDLISDMVTNIIYEDLCQLTETTVAGLKANIKSQRFAIKGKNYNLPENPFSRGTPIILLPFDILRDLPVATCMDDRSRVASFNQELRDRVGEQVGEIWRIKTQKDKSEALSRLLASKDAFETYLEYVESVHGKNYDLTKDPRGEVFWHSLFLSLPKDFNLELKPLQSKKKTPLEIVEMIIEEFKKCIEANGLWKELWAGEDHRDEKAAQRLFYAFSYLCCKINNLDIAPEANAGAGPVDFKYSNGADKILVEMKLSTNSHLIPGYQKQLEAYKAAERTQAAYYVVIQLDEQKNMNGKEKRLIEIKNQIELDGKSPSEIVIVDGRKKKSASKL